MSSEDDFPPIDEDASIEPAPRAFAPAEMVACDECLRANAPTRMNCLYCGALLPATDAARDLRRPTLRALEAWEQGFNVVLLPQPSDVLSADALAEGSSLLRLEAKVLREMAAAQTFLPLARTATREEAALIETKLRASGWRVEVVTDEELGVETHAPKRIRKLEFTNDALKGWTNADGEAETVAWSQVVLMLAGRISHKRIEVEERRSRRSEGEVVETREFFDDESAFDVYVAGSVVNWRIMAENFDYSCLGAQKSLTAAENFKRLVETFRARAAAAVYDDSYRGVRHYLKFAWPLAEQTEAGSLRRIRPGRYNSEAVTSTSNEAQFTRYGRLLQHFRLRGLTNAT